MWNIKVKQIEKVIKSQHMVICGKITLFLVQLQVGHSPHQYTSDQNLETSRKITLVYILHCWIEKKTTFYVEF